MYFSILKLEGFKKELLDVLRKIKKRRKSGILRGASAKTKFNRELKTLEWSIRDRGISKMTGAEKGVWDSKEFNK